MLSSRPQQRKVFLKRLSSWFKDWLILASCIRPCESPPGYGALRPEMHVADGITHVTLMELHWSQKEPTRNPQGAEPLYANGAENPEIFGCLVQTSPCLQPGLKP
ncbi:hypothetical protein O181_069762 [Austropuccinia psidii MF-1]|uniref:Uncharacterized protein n=1 Tax=Austropuccinia psidii MF-1 TaxID=1389203 RepID=A0A9Q3F1X5_9BASI|nr:hypothetical protein [Austropuccinia psidii MF-1]